jgi:hypothetical protein
LPHIKAVLSGHRVKYEANVNFKDVGPRLLHVIYTPDTDEFGKVQGWVASIIDVTEKRHAEQRIAADLHATTLLREVGSECAREDATLDDCLNQILDATFTPAWCVQSSSKRQRAATPRSDATVGYSNMDPMEYGGRERRSDCSSAPRHAPHFIHGRFNIRHKI